MQTYDQLPGWVRCVAQCESLKQLEGQQATLFEDETRQIGRLWDDIVALLRENMIERDLPLSVLIRGHWVTEDDE
jgi:hypothetical protein